MSTTPRRRPAVVTVAGALLAAAGAMFAGEVLLSASKYFTDMRVFEQAAQDGIVENTTAFAGVGSSIHLLMTVVGVFAGVVLVALAAFTLAGQAWARVVSWIFGVPILLWLAGVGFLSLLGHLLAGDDPQPTALTRRFQEAWPAWLNVLDVLLMVLVVVALLAALVCQTIPAADAWFRRTREDGHHRLPLVAN